MQKKIIALAIAAAFSAPAFADVTVYGVVDAGVAKISADGAKGGMQVLTGGLAGSRLGVKSVQDAGDMKVVAVLEYALDNATSDGLGVARQEMVALAGGFGTVAAGYLQTTGYDFAVKFDPTSGSAVSPLQSMTKGGGFLIGTAATANRAPRALAYISPDLGGVTVAVNYSTEVTGGLGNTALGSAAAEAKNTAYLLSATYGAGPLAVGGVYAAVQGSPAGTFTNNVTEMALGASYDLTVVKLFGTYQTNKVANASSSDTAMSFGVVAPVGPGAVAFSYAKSTKKSTAADDNGSGYTLAYLQGLSKTTTMYVAYNAVKNSATAGIYGVGGGSNILAPTNAMGPYKSSSLIAVGLNTKF